MKVHRTLCKECARGQCTETSTQGVPERRANKGPYLTTIFVLKRTFGITWYIYLKVITPWQDATRIIGTYIDEWTSTEKIDTFSQFKIMITNHWSFKNVNVLFLITCNIESDAYVDLLIEALTHIHENSIYLSLTKRILYNRRPWSKFLHTLGRRIMIGRRYYWPVKLH